MLVAGVGRATVLVRLLIWLALVAVYYAALLSQGFDVASDWFLLLVPALLLPYLVDLLGALAGGGPLVVDGRRRTLRVGRRTLATFAQVRALELRAVNGGCEELSLHAVLADGSVLRVSAGGDRGRITALAQEMSALLQVELRRGG